LKRWWPSWRFFGLFGEFEMTPRQGPAIGADVDYNPGQPRLACIHHVGRSVMSQSIVRELWDFLRVRKKFWLLPIVAVMLMFGLLMVLAQGSALAPFVYTIF
jgi:hypothetical protein